jgi:hypothetical protein
MGALRLGSVSFFYFRRGRLDDRRAKVWVQLRQVFSALRAKERLFADSYAAPGTTTRD